MDRRPHVEGKSSPKRRRTDGEAYGLQDEDKDAVDITTVPGVRKGFARALDLLYSPGCRPAKSSFGKTYTAFPLPGIEVNGAGFALPIRRGFAASGLIKALDDASVNNRQPVVCITNPRWSEWLSSVAVPQTCQELGVQIKVGCRLQTLISPQAGPLVSGEAIPPSPSSDGFAFLVVALPSDSTGGSIGISFAGETTTHRLDDSLFDATVVGWYHRDARHTISPSTEGSSFLLIYELYALDSAATLPSLQPWAEAGNEARGVLRRWKTACKGGLQLKRLCHFIPTSKNEHASDFKGLNSAKWKLLQETALLEGFKAVCVRVEVKKEGEADDSHCAEERIEYSEEEGLGGEQVCGCYRHTFLGLNDQGQELDEESEDGSESQSEELGLDGDVDEEEEQEQEAEEEDRTSRPEAATITTTWTVLGVESDNSTLGSSFHLSDSDMSPSSFFDFDDPDDESYEPRGDEPGCLTYLYYGAVLMLVPDEEFDRLIASTLTTSQLAQVLVGAIKKLENDPVTARTQADVYLDELGARTGDFSWHSQLFDAVCSSGDSNLFARLARLLVNSKSSSLMANIGQEALVLRAMKHYGFDAVRPLFDRIISTPVNGGASRTTGMDKLIFLDRVKVQDPSAVDSAWIASSLGIVFAGMPQPGAEAGKTVVGLMDAMSLQTFRESLLPKLPSVDFASGPTSSFWQGFTKALLSSYPLLAHELLAAAASTLPIDATTGTAFVHLATLAREGGIHDQVIHHASDRVLDAFRRSDVSNVDLGARTIIFVAFEALYDGHQTLKRTPPHPTILEHLLNDLIVLSQDVLVKVRATLATAPPLSSEPLLKQLGVDALSIHKVASLARSNRIVEELASALLPAGTTPSRELVDHVLVPVGRAVGAAREGRLTGPLRRFLNAILSAQLAELDAALRRPPSLRLQRVSCSCTTECSSLSDFLADIARHEWRLSANQGRRYHVEWLLAGRADDVTMVTEKIGSPHTLVVTKRASEPGAAMRQWERERAGVVAFVKAIAATQKELDELLSEQTVLVKTKLGQIF